MKKIGIIAGTKFDTQMGVDFFGKYFHTVSYAIANNPLEQTRLQALNKLKLTKDVDNAVKTVVNQGAEVIVINCNSLSGAIDLNQLRANHNIKIITPLDVYSNIAKKYSIFGLLAANCQSTSYIERLILSQNKDATIIGYGNVDIVKDIEDGFSQSSLIKKHNIVKICDSMILSGAQIIILGCTHFAYFYDELKFIETKLLEPSPIMLEMALSTS